MIVCLVLGEEKIEKRRKKKKKKGKGIALKSLLKNCLKINQFKHFKVSFMRTKSQRKEVLTHCLYKSLKCLVCKAKEMGEREGKKKCDKHKEFIIAINSLRFWVTLKWWWKNFEEKTQQKLEHQRKEETKFKKRQSFVRRSSTDIARRQFTIGTV